MITDSASTLFLVCSDFRRARHLRDAIIRVTDWSLGDGTVPGPFMDITATSDLYKWLGQLPDSLAWHSQKAQPDSTLCTLHLRFLVAGASLASARLLPTGFDDIELPSCSSPSLSFSLPGHQSASARPRPAA
eukprot:3049323-Rhodomonas_salina.1